MKHKTGSGADATKDYRHEATPHGGSLGATMNQGGHAKMASENNLPELLDQGRSTKRGDMLRPSGIKGLMGQ